MFDSDRGDRLVEGKRTLVEVALEDGHDASASRSSGTGDGQSSQWYAKARPCDFYDLKGAVEGLMAGLHIQRVVYSRLSNDPVAYTQPGASARIQVNGDPIGLIGEVHARVLEAYEVKQSVFIFEIDLTRLIACIPDELVSLPLPKYPATTRDATLIVDCDIEADRLLAQVRELDETLVESVQLIDVFQGQAIARNRKSVTLRVVYRSEETTLEDSQVNQLHKQIIDRLIDDFKAGLPA